MSEKTIDPRYAGTGGMPVGSPEAVAYRLAVIEMGKEHPDVYVRATQILHTMEAYPDCDYPQDADANGVPTHAECGCPA
jgi:hypothetical protein